MAVQYEVDQQLNDRLTDLFGYDSDNERFACRKRNSTRVSSAVWKKNNNTVAALKAEILMSNDPARGVKISFIAKPTVLVEKPTKVEVILGKSSSSSSPSLPDVKARTQFSAVRKQDAHVMDHFPSNVIAENQRIAGINPIVRTTGNSSNLISKNQLNASAKQEVHTSAHLPLNAIVKNQSIGKCRQEVYTGYHSSSDLIANKQLVARTEQKVDRLGHWPSDLTPKTQVIAEAKPETHILSPNLNTTTQDANVEQQAYISDHSPSALTQEQLTAQADSKRIIGEISDDDEKHPTFSGTKEKLMKYHKLPPSSNWWLTVLKINKFQMNDWEKVTELAEKEYLAEHNPKDQQEPFCELKCCFPLSDPRTIIKAVHRRSKKS